METDGLLDLNYTASPMLSDLGSQSIGLLTVLILICTATILGNLSVIIAIRVNRKLRARPTYHFIQSLAAADLALGVFVLPFSISLQIQQQWLFGDILCSVWAASDVLCCTASILSLCAISLERYLGVTQPLKHRVGSQVLILTLILSEISKFCLFWRLKGEIILNHSDKKITTY